MTSKIQPLAILALALLVGCGNTPGASIDGTGTGSGTATDDVPTADTGTGTESTPATCTDGETRCASANMVQRCKSGTWGDWSDCAADGKVCVLRQGAAGCEDTAATDGTATDTATSTGTDTSTHDSGSVSGSQDTGTGPATVTDDTGSVSASLTDGTNGTGTATETETATVDPAASSTDTDTNTDTNTDTDTDTNTDTDPCLGVSPEGCCGDNNIMYWCFNDDLMSIDCGDYPCGWKNGLGAKCNGQDAPPVGYDLECPTL